MVEEAQEREHWGHHISRNAAHPMNTIENDGGGRNGDGGGSSKLRKKGPHSLSDAPKSN